MPVITVNKNYSPISGQKYIWFTWKIISMTSVSVDICPKPSANHQFGLTISPLDFGHIEATYLRRMYIHGQKCLFPKMGV